MSDVISLATKLADEFRPRAAEYDRSGEFPTENYARMRDAGYLRALVPEELGGLGATLAEMSQAQRALARGDASTALAVNMHQFQVGTAADAWRKGGPTEPILRRIADEGIVLASTGAESIVFGDWVPSTTATKDGEDYVINGRKFFCSQASGFNVVRVNALDSESGDTLVFAIPRSAEGVGVDETWDTMGMRATASHDLTLDNVRMPATAIGTRWSGPPMRAAPMPTVARWFLCMVSGVYLGIAEEARAEAYKALGKGINSSFRDEALTNVLVGEMEAFFRTAASVLESVTRELDEAPADLQYALTQSVICKEVVTANSIATVDKAIEIAGGKAYFRKSPLERLTRDVRASRFHPPASPVSFQLIGERSREQMAATAPVS